MTDVAKAEGFKLKPEAADLIAIAASGSFRDALGVLQKVMLASGDTIGSADEVSHYYWGTEALTLSRTH